MRPYSRLLRVVPSNSQFGSRRTVDPMDKPRDDNLASFGSWGRPGTNLSLAFSLTIDVEAQKGKAADPVLTTLNSPRIMSVAGGTAVAI